MSVTPSSPLAGVQDYSERGNPLLTSMVILYLYRAEEGGRVKHLEVDGSCIAGCHLSVAGDVLTGMLSKELSVLPPGLLFATQFPLPCLAWGNSNTLSFIPTFPQPRSKPPWRRYSRREQKLQL